MDMDMNLLWITLSVSALILAAAAVFFLVKRYKKIHNQIRGKKGEKRVAKVLAKYARFREAKVINGIYLPLYDETTEIDHILIAPFGVMVIETKNWAGSVYGDPNEEKWLQELGEARNYHYNPLFQNKTHIDNIRHIFKKENIYRTNVEGVVVFADRRCNLYCPRKVKAMKLKQFKKLLKSNAYEVDNKVDVEKVYNAILKYQVTDRKKIAQHDSNVKRHAEQ